MFKFFEKYLMGPMTKISQLNLIRAVTAAGMASIPFTIVGSIFLILTVIPQAFPALAPAFEAGLGRFTDVYMIGYKASMGIIGLYFLVVIAYEYAKIIRDEGGVEIDPLTAALLAVFGFFMLIPEFIKDKDGLHLIMDPENGYINGWQIGGDGPARLSATGIFTAILISRLVVNIYKMCIKKNIIIKMPDSVPQGVANSFSALIPAIFVSLTIIILNGILVALGTDIFKVIAIPFGFVTKIADSLGGILLIFFLISALWIVGIHGATIISSLLAPIVLTNLAENVAGANHVFAGEFYNAFVFMGGSGGTLGLTIMCAFLAKSDQLKTLGRAAVVPAFFNINEPMIFGLPIVYNPYLAFPFFLAPMAEAAIAYISIKTGLIHPIIAQQPWPTPIGLGAFIATGGDWKAIIVALVCALVAALIYFPFFKAYDKKLLKEQEENADDDDDFDF